MANIKELKKKIKSTKGTWKITQAMKLVSAAKLRKAQQQILNVRPYAQSLLKVIANIAASNKIDHPLLKRVDQPKRILLMVLTSDRGLCGAFNSNINKFTENYARQNQSKFEVMDYLFIGKRAIDYFSRKGVKAIDTITRLDKDVSYSLAAKTADQAMKYFLNGSYDEIHLIYNEFKSAISQKVTAEVLLPVDISKQTLSAEDPAGGSDMLFEPSPEKIMEELLSKHFSVQVYRSMCESVAAEHGARMSAMENATNNAKEVLNKLTLTYNKLRQEKITTELIEIVSGAEAL
jgi:F-type H+-transporting ATPase subunit gamma